MSRIKLTVIAPVYNEEEVIGDFHAALGKVLTSLSDVDSTILYVIDRCRDNSLQILRSIAKRDPRVIIIALSSRFGHQMSLVAGIDNAIGADAVVMMDSDLQHPPELIPELLANFRRGFEVVYTVRQDTKSINPIRKLAGNIFYRMLSKISSAPINANAADFRLISGRVAEILSANFRERKMFLRGLFSWIGFKQIGVEYVAGERVGGFSKYSLSKTFELAAAGVLSFSTKPLQLGIVIGMVFSVISFILIIWTVFDYFLEKSIPSGWATIVVLLLMFSGIQLIVLGIIGSYIGGIYEEVKDRPRYIIDKIFNGKDT